LDDMMMMSALYTRPTRWGWLTYLVLAHWKNSLRIDMMSPH